MPATASLNAIQQLMAAQQFAAAQQQLAAVLQQQPQHIEALYMAAVCNRYLQHYETAQTQLNRLFALQFDHGRAHQEQGYLHRQQQQPAAALLAFQRAVHINPALVSSWRAIASLSRDLQQPALGQQALAQLHYLNKLPKALVAISDLLAQGKLGKAETLCRQVLQRQPQNVEAMRLLANIASRMGALHEAELLLESGVSFEPDNIQLKIDYIQLLRKRQKFQQALQQAEALLAIDPNKPQFQSLYAIEALQTGNHTLALDYFERVLQQLPNDVNTLVSRGHALKTAGTTANAIASYQQATQINPGHGEAWYALANLKTYRFSSAELSTMQTVENQLPRSLMDKVYLHFALGKAFEDQRDFSRSFTYYQQGNALKQQQSGYKAHKMTQELAAQHRFFTPAQCAALQGLGNPARDPIFIVGLPRAGSTLLEQILSSHSQVDGTLELPNMLAIAQELRHQSNNTTYPEVIAELSTADLQQLGNRYIEETRIHRQQAPFFIDKMPNNFRHIGLIKTILPNASIIDARRHPVACCFSAFKQLFAEGQEFSYAIPDIAQYYRDYVALMAHWDTVFAGAVHRVYYERLVAELEGEVKALLHYCGLPFEAQCLEFHKTERAVRTASSEQVRQPLYQSGVDQWRCFDNELAELKQLLGDLVVDYAGG